MEKIILRQKWLGLLAVVLVSLFMALHTAGSLSEAYIELEPTISQEIGYFLPITFKNGQIVYPQNTLIEHSYGHKDNSYKIVLNTKVEDLNIADLTSGIYVTRNKVYSYDAKKGEVKIQSLAKMPDAEVTESEVREFLDALGGYLKPVSTLFIFVMLSIYIGLAALVYTIFMHWLFKKLYNADFALTLRVNTLAYLALFCITALSSISCGIIITFLIMLACNYLANILLENK